MKTVYLVFSHTLTAAQREELLRAGISDAIALPEELQFQWSHVPAGQGAAIAARVAAYLDRNAKAGDWVLVQGAFGASFALADYCLQVGLVPVYAETERISSEVLGADGTVVKTSVFQHRGFVPYTRCSTIDMCIV